MQENKDSTVKTASALVEVETRTRHELGSERIAIGRLPENNIVLSNDIYVSSMHAVIFPEHQGWWLEDLKSTNGTFKNNTPVTERVSVDVGDLITFGRTKFEVV